MRGFYTTTDFGKASLTDGSSRWFATIACSGFVARVAASTHRVSGKLRPLRSPLGTLLELPNLRCSPCTITLDGTETISADMLLVAVGNTKFYGQGIMICPDASHHDGLFEISIVTQVSLPNIVGHFRQFYRQSADVPEFLTTNKARTVRI